jgi:hypothetical protein
VCRLSIRLPNGEVLTKEDAGGYPDMKGASADEDSEKGGFSDAFKRSSVKFGVTRYLYGDGVARLTSASEDRPVSGMSKQAAEVSSDLQTGSEASEAAPEGSSSERLGSQYTGLAPAEAQSFWDYLHTEMDRCNSAWESDYSDKAVARNPDTGLIVDHTDLVPYLFKQAANRKLLKIKDGPIGKQVGELNRIWLEDERAANWLRGHIKKFLTLRYRAKEAEVNGSASTRGGR